MKLANFQNEPIEFVETIDVKSGVECDVYNFENNKEKDLGIISVAAGQSTPRQKVLKGDHTIEGYISGSGRLVVENGGGKYLMNSERVFRSTTQSK